MKQNAIVIFGGKSFEHDISIITALIVLRKATNSKYNLLPVYVSKNEEWFYFAGENLRAENFKHFEETYKKDGFKKVRFDASQKSLISASGLIKKTIKVDVVLNCCHGGAGEDGGLTALFEMANIPITSGDKTALGVCMDKVLSKYIFKGMNVPVIDFYNFTREAFAENKELILKKVEELGYPVILKPATLGSSIGINVVHKKEEFDEAVKVALEFDNNILVEKALLEDMKEYNVACMRKDGKVIVSKIDMPIKTEEILSFNDKYIGDNSSKASIKKGQKTDISSGSKGGGYLSGETKKFAKVPQKIAKQISAISSSVYEKLALSGVVRFDYILDRKNKVFLNEINTVPGSLGYYFFVPHVFNSFSEFIDCLLLEAIKIREKRLEIKKEYITNIF